MNRLLWTILFLTAVCSAAFAQRRIPALLFRDTENTLVRSTDLPKGKALMLVYFRSDCDHCIHTAQMLKGNTARYPALIWMVSAESIDALRTFEDMTGFYDAPNLRVLQDHTQSMHKWFDFSKLPFIVVFDKAGRQVRTYDELPPAAVLKKDMAGK